MSSSTQAFEGLIAHIHRVDRTKLLPPPPCYSRPIVNGMGISDEEKDSGVPMRLDMSNFSLKCPPSTSPDKAKHILDTLKPVVDPSKAHPRFVDQCFGWCDCPPDKALAGCKSCGVGNWFRCQHGEIVNSVEDEEFYSHDLEAVVAMLTSTISTLIDDHGWIAEGFFSWRPDHEICDMSDVTPSATLYGTAVVHKNRLFRSGGFTPLI